MYLINICWAIIFIKYVGLPYMSHIDKFYFECEKNVEAYGKYVYPSRSLKRIYQEQKNYYKIYYNISNICFCIFIHLYEIVKI